MTTFISLTYFVLVDWYLQLLCARGSILTKSPFQLICSQYSRCDGRTFFQLVCPDDMTGETELTLRLLGDLGVQRGLLRWFLSLHSPYHSFSVSPEKVGGSRETETDNDELPFISDGESIPMDIESSSILPDSSRQGEDLPEIPPSFTPSIKKVLTMSGVNSRLAPAPLPPGLDVAALESRLKGKKTKCVAAQTSFFSSYS
jgi:hypothetical protein